MSWTDVNIQAALRNSQVAPEGRTDGCSVRAARIQGKSLRRGKNSDLHVWKQLFILRRPLQLDFEYAVLMSNLLPIFEFQLSPRLSMCVRVHACSSAYIDADR